MSHTDQPADFSLLLASSVHDIKNSLGMLITSLNEEIDLKHCQDDEQRQRWGILQSEASRINHALIHLLGIYRLDNQQLSLKRDEVYVEDFLEEQIASQQLLFDINQVSVRLDCDSDLCGFFDPSLISGLIGNILVNCAKYTKDQITVSAEEDAGYLVIKVQDNGTGYPQHIIDSLNNTERGIDFNSGSTNLGLYFAQAIAGLHQLKDRSGAISISNNATGGCFALKLP